MSVANVGIDSAKTEVVRQARTSWRVDYARRLIVVDVIGVLLSVNVAQWLRFGGLLSTGETYRTVDYTAVSLIVAVAWLSALSINNSRSVRIIGVGAEEYRRVWMATLFVFGGVAIVSMLLKLDIARGYLMIALPIGLFALLGGRWAARRAVRSAREKHGRCKTRVLVVGNQAAVRDLTQSLARDGSSGYEVIGACVSGRRVHKAIGVPGVGAIPVLGDESDVVPALVDTRCEAVALTAADHLDSRWIRNLSWDLEKLDVELLVSPGVVDVAGPRLTMRPVAGLPLIHVEKPRYHGAKRFEKRAFDIAFASMVLAIGAPVLLAIALAVKVTSRGPVFYRAERIGLDGQPFQMIKFRTMVDGADQMVDSLAALNECDGGVLFKIRSDPRVTPLGRILRKYSVDELPQFINVLKRDMSVVGPRPPLAREVQSYDNHVMRRLLVRPGITGLWQVSGRSDLSWEDAIRLDLFYVENWSMMTDVVIAGRTLKAVLGGAGAY